MPFWDSNISPYEWVGREAVKLNSVSNIPEADKVALLYSGETPKPETRNLTLCIEVAAQNYLIKRTFASLLHCRLEVQSTPSPNRDPFKEVACTNSIFYDETEIYRIYPIYPTYPIHYSDTDRVPELVAGRQKYRG